MESLTPKPIQAAQTNIPPLDPCAFLYNALSRTTLDHSSSYSWSNFQTGTQLAAVTAIMIMPYRGIPMKRLLKVTLLLWSRGPVYAEGDWFL